MNRIVTDPMRMIVTLTVPGAGLSALARAHRVVATAIEIMSEGMEGDPAYRAFTIPRADMDASIATVRIEVSESGAANRARLSLAEETLLDAASLVAAEEANLVAAEEANQL